MIKEDEMLNNWKRNVTHEIRVQNIDIGYMAEDLSLSETFLKESIDGENLPDVHTMLRIAEYLEVDDKKLLFDTRENKYQIQINPKIFAGNLARMLEKSGMSKSEFYSETGVTIGTLNLMLSGNTTPTIYSAYNSSIAFGKTVDEMIFEHLDDFEKPDCVSPKENGELQQIFSENFKELLASRRTNVSRFSKMVGIPRATMYNYKSGSSLPPISTLKNIADYFEVTIHFMLEKG